METFENPNKNIQIIFIYNNKILKNKTFRILYSIKMYYNNNI